MKIFYSLPSPFAAKARLAAHHCDIELEGIPVDTSAEPEDLLSANPLGKIPTLLLDDGTTLYDSRVICEHFDRISGNLLIPQASEAWLQAKRVEALADGVADAGILCAYEVRYRPEAMRHQPWIDKQWRRAMRGLAALETEVADLPQTPNIGHFALAALLGWLVIRFPGQWEDQNPQLAEWLKRFPETFPAFAELGPKPMP